jgi:hypothetical protein
VILTHVRLINALNTNQFPQEAWEDAKNDLLYHADLLDDYGWNPEPDDIDEDLEKFSLRGDYDPQSKPETRPKPGLLTSEPPIKKPTAAEKSHDEDRATRDFFRYSLKPRPRAQGKRKRSKESDIESESSSSEDMSKKSSKEGESDQPLQKGPGTRSKKKKTLVQKI